MEFKPSVAAGRNVEFDLHKVFYLKSLDVLPVNVLRRQQKDFQMHASPGSCFGNSLGLLWVGSGVRLQPWKLGLLASTVLLLACGCLSPLGTSARLCVMRFQSPGLSIVLGADCPEVGHLVIRSGSWTESLTTGEVPSLRKTWKAGLLLWARHPPWVSARPSPSLCGL